MLLVIPYILWMLFDGICGYKILMLCPPPTKSHHNLCKAVTDTLADRGHEITLISAFPSINPKYREIQLDMNEFKETFPMGLELANMTLSKAFNILLNWGPVMFDSVFKNADVLNLYNNKTETFDLFIVEYYINEIFLGFSVRFNCPAIVLSSLSLMTWLSELSGNPIPIATVPHINIPYTQNMNFFQRVKNLNVHILQHMLGKIIFKIKHESLYNKYFLEESKIVTYDRLNTLISSVLVNTHPSFGIVRPLLPNAIEIGGYHIEDPKPLSEDLQKIMDDSKNGVIFFSMGSNVQSKNLHPYMRNAILNTFSNLNETILWKFEEDMPEKPKNVIIKKWMPQTSILAHVNTKLFISHGGLLSCTEAVHFGVPMLIIPIFGDQPQNAMQVAEKGFGLHLSYSNITETSLKWTLDEILSNPKYAINAKRISELYHDRPMKPRDLMAYHIEHVIRTKGARHLSPPKISIYSNLLLDVIAIVIIPSTIIVLFIFYLFFKLCCVRGKKSHDNKIKKS